MKPVTKRRGMALLLALACLLGLIPPLTLAADSPQSTIKLNSITWTSGNYQSAYFERPCQIQDFRMNVGSLTISGFCGDHSKRLNNSHIGDTWSSPEQVTNSVVTTMLAYYYTHLLGEEYYNDECKAKGFDYQISGDAVLQYNGWIQEVVWMWSTDQIPSDYEGQVEMVAQAYRESFDARNGTHHASIDDQIVADSPNTFKSVTELILSNPGAWCECPVYRYVHPNEEVQPILVGYPQKVPHTTTPGSYQITVKKVDTLNPDLILAGAKFRLVSVTDPDFTPQTGTTGADGTYTFRSLPAGTYAVTETEAPSGYRMDSPGPVYISLPGNDGATVTQVFTDTPDNPPSGDIRKVAKDNPTTGLAGATIAIEGIDNGFRGEYQTGAGGALEGLDWSSMPYGSYRAYETTAPQGYTLSNEVKTFNISAENRHVQLVFANDSKVKAQLLKVDASNNPLPGAVFNIVKDGQIIGTEATDASGRITVSNVTEGMYAFVEVSAPAGYARMDQPTMVYVDQATVQGGGTVTVTAVNKRLPELKISKVDARDNTPVPGTVFTVEGIDSDYRADWTMGADGTYTASIAPGAYRITEKSVPEPYVLDASNVRTVSLNPGDVRELVFQNHKNPQLRVLKIDAADSTPVPGTVFAVEGVDNDYRADWTMGEDGSCTLRLSPGTYRITEKSVPEPYVLDEANNTQTVSLNPGDEREIVFRNRKNPTLIVSKIDAVDGRPIPGTVFTVEGIDNSFRGDWTTGMSGAVSQRVEPGTYRVTEKSVPAPYYLPELAAERVQTIRLNAGDEKELVFRDYKEPEITIYKVDSVTRAPIEGAQFHVTYTSNGASAEAPATYDFGTFYTDARGEILLYQDGIRLYPGEYTITETAPAPGFQMKEPTTQTVILNGGESKSVTFRNEPLNAIAVEKYDSVTGRPLEGATFRLRYLSGTSGTGGTIIGTKTTGANGSAIWTGLEAGTYIVEEVSAPPGYNILQISETVHITNNGEQTVITIPFYNAQDGSVLIRKIDSVTHAPLAGVEFEVTDSRGTFIGDSNGRYVSNAGGIILIEGVTPGTTLVIRETRTIPGYVLDDTTQTITVEAGKVNTVEFRNQPEPTIIVYKQDAQTGRPLAGVSFSVKTSRGTAVGDGVFLTDEDGKIVLTGLNPDTYIVTETATIPGYVLDRTPCTVVVGPAETRTLTVRNQPRARLLIQKFDRVTGLTLAGAEFRIVPVDAALLTDNEGLTSANNLYRTDENGQILLENLLPGAYLITEVTPPEGYALDEEAQTVTLRPGVLGQAWFYNSPLASLTILKRDAISLQPLANAEFTVRTTDGTLVGDNNGVYVTGEDGMATVTGLQPNETLVVTEDSAPAGYVKDGGPRTIRVRSGTVNSLIFNDNPTTTLIIHKYASGTDRVPLAGVEFKVVNSKGEVVGMNNGIFYTDSQGDIMITGLEPGVTINVRETKTLDGFVLDGTAQEILIQAGDKQELTFWNQRRGSLILRKVDSETGSPLAGAEFHIAFADGRPVDMEHSASASGSSSLLGGILAQFGLGTTSSNGRYVTDERGEIVIPGVVGTIVATEVRAPEGYAIDPANRSQTVEVRPEDAQTLTFGNPRLQTLTVTKYQAGTTTPVSGASFLVTDGYGAGIGPSRGEYVTDRNGQFVISDLEPGTNVTVRETAAPDEFVLDGTPQSIEIRSGAAQSMTFYNALKGSITIRKTDSSTGAALAGAQFRVTAANGEAITVFTGAVASGGVFTTDRNGEIRLNRVQPGTYTVREVQPPSGYVLDEQPQTVVLEAGGEQTVTFADAPKGSLVIRKTDSLTHAPLSGAEFRVTTADGTYVADNQGRTSSNGLFVTDEAGQIVLSRLEPGTYVVTETKAPDNYYLNTSSQTVAVNADDAQTVTFADEPFAALTIRKVDALTGDALPGAEFNVKDSGGETIGSYTTGTDGTAVVSGLKPNSTVVATETRAPEGYVLADRPQTIRVGSGRPNSLTFENSPLSTLVIRKYIDGTDNEPLSGVRFQITDGSGAAVGPDDGFYTTDTAGEIRLTGLTPGITVKAREVQTVRGFVLDGTPQDIVLLPGQEQVLTFRNKRSGSLTVRKLDGVTREPLSGVEFKLTYADGRVVDAADGQISSNGTYFTDSHGEIVVNGVVGTIVVTEVRSIAGYSMDPDSRSQTVTVHPNDGQTVTFFNVPAQSLTITKYVKGTTTPIPGVEFLLTDSTGAVIGPSGGKYVTDEDGRIVVTGLTPGVTVTAKETRAADGFVLDASPKSIAIRQGEAQSLTFYNEARGALLIVKKDAETDAPLSGAVFQVLTSSGQYVADRAGRLSSNGLYTTDSRGQILISELDPVTLVVRETQAPEGYALDAAPQTVDIRADDMQTLTFTDQPLQTVTIRKFINGTDKPLPGVTFQVVDGSGKSVGSGEYITDAAGKITIPGIAPGTVISAREVKTVKGYSLNGTPKNLEVRTGQDNALTFFNDPLSSLVIHKYVDGTENEPLSGVGFKIVDGSGAAVGNADGVYYTDAAGEITLTDLEPGTVIKAREFKTVSGYVLDGTPQDIQITAPGVYELTFWNKKSGSLTVKKLDSVTREPLSGVEFKLTYADGRVVDTENGQISSNGTYFTNERGEIVISGIVGTIVVTEVRSIEGYSINPDSKSQTVTVNPSNGQTVTFFNDPAQTLIIQKYAAGTTDPIPGTEFLITDSHGTVIGPDGGKYVTDEDGRIVIRGLNIGVTIKAQETKAAEGFVLDGSPKTIAIRQGDAQTLTFYNEPKQSVIIQKYIDGTTKPLAGVTFLVTDSAGNRVGEYVTDQNGQIVLSGLNPGTVLIAREVRTVKGYVLNGTPQTITVGGGAASLMTVASSGASGSSGTGGSSSGGSGNTLTFYDEPLSTLVIHKYIDGTDNEPLDGVDFKITDGADKALGTSGGVFTTDNTGTITVEGIEPGTTVKVQEVRTVDGFVLDGTPQTVKIESSDVHELTFRNKRQGSLTVKKQDSVTGAALSGAEFKITYADGRVVDTANGQISSAGTYVTNERGEIVISGVTGTIVVTEVKAPQGYTINPDAKSQTVEVSPNDGQTLVFKNDPTQTLTIQKYVTGTTDPLPGVEFLVRDSGGEFVGQDGGKFVTDEHGQIVISGLVPGVTITAKETKTVSGYVLDSTPQSIKIKSGEAQTLAFYNAPKGSLLVRKIDSVTERPIPGAEFKITTLDGSPVADNEGRTSTNGIYKTDANGEIVLLNVQPGTYRVAETAAPEGYVLNTEAQTVTVSANDSQTLTFKNVPLQTLRIQKYVKGTTTPLSGVTFHVTDADGANIGPNQGDFVTDERGQILITGLTPGVTVKAQETETVSGYVLDSTPQTVKIKSGEVQTLTYYNAPKGTLTVRKLDSATEQPLSGAEFKITTLDGTPVDDNEGRTSTNGIYRTDANGEIVLRNVQPGGYKVSETAAPEGYVLNTEAQTVTVRASDHQTLTFKNVPLESVTIQKFIDGTTKPLAGVTFLVTDGAGTPVGGGSGEYVTDENGRVTISGIAPGTTIVAREVRTVKGYVLNGTPQTITVGVSSGAGGTRSGANGNTLTFYDEPLSTLVIHKYIDGTENEPLPGVEFKITDSSGAALGTSGGLFTTDATGTITVEGIEPGTTVKVQEVRTVSGFVLDGKPQTVKINSSDVHELTFRNQRQGSLTVKKQDSVTGTPLSGAEFKITYADGRVVDTANGQISSGGTYVTNERGEIVISGVTGTIVVTEVKAPQGYTINLDSKSQTVEVKPNDGQTLIFKNDPTQTLTIQKFITGTTDPLSGVTFLVRDSGGEFVGQDGGKFVTDEHGQIVISGLVPGVTITAKETKTVSGYVLDSTPQSIKIKSGEDQKLVFFNAPKGSLTVRKVDSLTEQPLSGAEFKITTLDGSPVDDNEGQTSTNGIYKTDENGEIVLLKLQPGTYRVAETVAPEGYVLNTEAQTVTVNAKDSQTLTFKNVPLQSVTIRKYIDGTTKPLAGVTFQVTDAAGTLIGEYVTDENGEIVVSGLVPGSTIIAREIRTVKGYVLNGTPQTITVGVSGGAVQVRSGANRVGGNSRNVLTFYDEPLSTLVIHKYIADTDNEPLEGVDFKITDGAGKALGTSGGLFTTDNTGTITVENIEPGTTVKVQEVKTVSGFVLDGTPQTVKIESTDVHELTFRNQRQSSVTVKKQDSVTGEPLSGAEFKITYADGRVVDTANGQISSGGTYVTNERGEIVISGVTGTIVVTEVKAPQGYTIDPDSKSQTVEVKPNDGQTLVFKNDPTQTLTIQKYVTGTTDPLSGVEFLIRDSGGEYVGQDKGKFVTDEHGQIVISGLIPGVTITAKETKTVSGYALDSTPQSIKIKSGEAQTLTFFNTPLQSVTIRKYEAGTTKPLSGVTFTVTDGAGKKIGEYVTDENGEIVVPDLAPGTTVIAREVRTVKGYVLNGTPQNLQVEIAPLTKGAAGGVNILTFYDEPMGALVIRKYVEGTENEPLPGVEFKLTDASGAAVGNGTYYTDRSGEIVLENLEPGLSVTARETRTVSGYVLDGKPQTAKIASGDVKEMVFWNSRQGSLTVKKQDSVTGAPLSGAEFKITYADGRVVDTANGQISSAGTYVTNERGEIVISGVTGTIVVTEVKAPQGYTINPDAKSQTVEVKPNDGQTLVFKNDPTQTLTIQKFITGTTDPLPGVEFLVRDSGGEYVGQDKGKFVTDEHGQIVISGLVPGVTITAKETKTVSGYALDSTPQSIKIKSGEAQTLTFFNTPLQSVTIRKYVDGTTKPLAGVTFSVTDAAGTQIGEFVTDENGEIVIPGLTPGAVITAREIRTVKGYVLNGTPQTITVGVSGGAVQARPGANGASSGNTMTFYDEPLSTLVIHKYIDGTDNEPLEGVEFKITDGAGKALGTSGGVFTTDATGTISVENIEPGTTVKVQEIKTAPGFVLDGRPQTVKIESSDVHELTFRNQRQGSLTVKKQDSVTGTPLSGAEFKITYADGRVVDTANGQISSVGTYVTNERGEIVISGVTGTIIVTEVKAPQGYTINPDSKSQTVEVKPNDGQTLVFKNDLTQTLTIQKYVTGTTDPLPGVEFLVRDSGGEYVGQDKGRFVTDANGQIVISGLVPGVTITAKETKTVSGYVLDSTPQSIKIKSGEAQTLTFFNTPKGTLTVRKIDSVTEEPLSGAEFKITTLDGTVVDDNEGRTSTGGIYKTDEHGEIVLAKLQPGGYRIAEMKAPEGYVLNPEAQTVTVNANDHQTVTFKNTPLQSVTIQKYIEGTNKPLAGVTFLITDAAGTPVGGGNGEYVTDAKGRITLSGLVPGTTLIAREIRTVKGYVLNGNPQTIVVGTSGGAATAAGTASGAAAASGTGGNTLTFYDGPLSTLVIRKFIEGTDNEPLSGVEFKITDSSGAAVGSGTYYTDRSGEIKVENLEPGQSVTVRETKTVSGYVLDGKAQTAKISSGDVLEMVFWNARQGALTIKKQDSVTSDPVPGTEFSVKYADGRPVDTENGQLSSGGSYVTDEHGEIHITGITGTIIITEEKAAPGYTMNPDGRTKIVTVNPGETQTVTFANAPSQTLTITKYETGTTKPIQGAAFLVTAGNGAAVGDADGEFVTDANGRITIPGLTPGTTVTAKEIRAAQGYVLDGSPKTITIKSGAAQSLTFYNSPEQTLTIHKYVTGTTTPIKGAAFLVTDQTGATVGGANGEHITDENGTIVLNGLTPGAVITVKETRAADGYALDSTPKSITIQSGAAQSLNFYNSPTGTLIVEKRDKATEKPLKGAVFQILTADGKYVPNAGGQLSSNGSYTTDDKGQIIITGLSTDTLVVKETKAPSGYILDDTPQTVKVGPNDTQTLTFYDAPEKNLTIQKYVTGTTDPIPGVTFLLTDSTGATIGPDQGEYTTDRNGRISIGGLTPGTTVTAKEIRTADGYVLDTKPQSITIKEGAGQTLTFYNEPVGGLELIKVDAADKTVRIPNTTFEIRRMDGGLVKKITTGKDGRIYAALDAGDYYLVEVEAANGYKIDPTPEYVTIQDGKTTTVTITNVASSGILLHKTDASTGKGLYGVTFLLYDAKNNPIGQYTTDNKGYIRIEDMTAGKYFLRELENKGYVPDTELKTVYVKSGETTLVEWKNIPITAQIQITKKSADYNPTNGLPAGTLLECAVFEIRDKASNLVDTIQSDKNGLAVSKPLPLGRYTIRETKAPANYGVNETEWTAYLEHEGQIVRFEIADKALVTGVNITKTGPKQVMAGQPCIFRFSGIGNTSNVRLDSFYWRDVIPAQVRLQTVVTGTYNYPGTYKITYRVNGGEPRTLADSLSTQKNYTLAASATALGLKSDERVTEIMFVFGQAPAGFSQVEAPSLTCTVIPNVLANSFANSADVGGMYAGQWVQGVSRWVTTVYRKPTPLPKTGY